MSQAQTYKVVFRFADVWIIDSQFCLIDVKCTLVVLLNLARQHHTNTDNASFFDRQLSYSVYTWMGRWMN